MAQLIAEQNKDHVDHQHTIDSIKNQARIFMACISHGPYQLWPTSLWPGQLWPILVVARNSYVLHSHGPDSYAWPILVNTSYSPCILVMAYIVVAWIVMPYPVMAYMAYIVMNYTIMTYVSHGVYSYGLYYLWHV